MDKDLFNGLFAVTTAIVGVALISVILSKNSNTTGVLDAYGNSFSQLLGTAESPTTGQTASASTYDLNSMG